MRGWGGHGLVTAGHSGDWRAVRRACAAAGLDPTGAALIHHYSNAIYLLPAQDAVARVTRGRDMAGQVGRSQAVTRWLAQAGRFPAARPLGCTAPVSVDGAVVSFWDYYPQPAGGPTLTSAHLAVVLRLLHRIGAPPVALPAWVPLESPAGGHRGFRGDRGADR